MNSLARVVITTTRTIFITLRFVYITVNAVKSRLGGREISSETKISCTSKSDAPDPLSRDTYTALALHGYNAAALRWTEAEMPLELQDDQLLVKVEAASINALDVDMMHGYGQQLFESVRPLPAVLGRDFSGVVVGKGSGVWNYKVGDHVIGTPLPFAQGTFGEYCIVSEFHVAAKPKNLSHVEAAALPYAALTAMKALEDAKLLQGPASGPVAVLGATGGVGTSALQLLTALTPPSPHGPIIAVARPGSPHTEQLEALLAGRARVVAGGPELAISTAGAPFSAIVDLAGVMEEQWLPLLREGGAFSTVRGNLIKTAQEYQHFTIGLGVGFASYLSHKLKVQKDHNINYTWSYFWPSSDKLELIAKLAEESKIKPVVDRVFEARDYQQAFEYLEGGGHFGKVVLSFEHVPTSDNK